MSTSSCCATGSRWRLSLPTSLARATGRDAAQLALAFALLNPSVTTVLFGATRPEQVMANIGALAVADELTPGERDQLAAIGRAPLAQS